MHATVQTVVSYAAKNIEFKNVELLGKICIHSVKFAELVSKIIEQLS